MEPMSDLAGDIGIQHRGPLQRPREERLVLGVCGAIAKRFAVDVVVVRVLVVMVGAVADYMFLAYLIGALVIPKAPRLTDQWGNATERRRPRRQLFAYVLLSIAANAVLHDTLPTGRAFAVALIVGGLLLMQLRSRAVADKPVVAGWHAPSTDPAAGGWTATAPLPPRWGLAGETVNPQVWNPAPASPASGEKRQSIWQTQFGNLALVLLVSVLAVGLWSNTSRSSPVRRAALKERLASGPVALRTHADVEELNSESLGDGSFVIDARALNASDVELNLKMGNGKLEFILPNGFTTTGEIRPAAAGVVVARYNSSALKSPYTFTHAVGSDKAPKFVFSVTSENGFVCVRTSGASPGCADQPNDSLRTSPPKK
jgi:phage shock protein C